MIITKTMLENMGACPEAMQWCVANNAYGTTLEQVKQMLWDAGHSEWYLWARDVLSTATAIMNQEAWEYFGSYRVVVFDGTATEFETLAAAEAHLVAAEQEFHDRFCYMFSVHAVTCPEPGTTSMTPCCIDLTYQPPAGDWYAAFDHHTGQYVNFDTFAEAQSFALAKREARHAECHNQFFIERQVREVGSSVSAWARITQS